MNNRNLKEFSNIYCVFCNDVLEHSNVQNHFDQDCVEWGIKQFNTFNSLDRYH